MKCCSLIKTIVLSVGLVYSLPATASLIISPIDAFSSTGNLSSRPIGETINGTGLSSGGASGDILTETHNPNNANGGEYWIGTNGGTLDFKLPSASSVDAVHIWNYARTGQLDRAIASFDLLFSSDPTTTPFGSVSYGATVLNITGINDRPNHTDPLPVQSLSFAEQTGVTFVRLANITNYGDGTYTGLSEIRFGSSPTVIPEPSNALIVGSLFALSALRRKRRRRQLKA